MDIMAIAATSIAMHQSQLEQAVDIAVMRKAMDSQEAQAAELIKDLEQAVLPSSHKLDITV